MIFSVDASLLYTAKEPGAFILNIHARRYPQTLLEEYFKVDAVHTVDEISSFREGNRLVRITTTEPASILMTYRAVVERSYRIVHFSHSQPIHVAQLPAEALYYLNPSRYCESDKLTGLAESLFGHIENEFTKVRAVTDWVHNHVKYESGSTTAQTTACDTLIQGAGVCRDFAHLCIAFCRALTIPARYCSVYAYLLNPQDFHACFEVYLSGYWVVFDASRLAPLNGFVRIATGRDAADTAISNIFGDVTGESVVVNCSLTEGYLEPVFYDNDEQAGVVYDMAQ